MKKAYFIADLHLGASYWPEARREEQLAVELLDQIREDASEVYLLGDILDYWFEYKHVVPRGYVRFFGKLAQLADEGVKVTWLIGNHDIWIFDYIQNELGVEVVDGILEREIAGVPFCIQHGDAVGGSRKFRFMRRMFRNRTCQKLYSGIHPRWTVGFAKACSKKSRMGYKPGETQPTGRLIHELEAWCRNEISAGNPAMYYIFGHLHHRHEIFLPEGRELVVVPDFASGRQFAFFDGEKLSFSSLIPKRDPI